MRRSNAVLLASLVLSGAAGCQDTWAGFLREERSLKNELADYMIRVVDEETAQYVVEGPAKKLKDKWEDHKERLTKYVKGQDLGNIEIMFKQLETRSTYKMGFGKSERIFTKTADGQITMEGPPLEDSAKEAVDSRTDPDFSRSLQAAKKRMDDQEDRIGRIQPAGPFLRKAKTLRTEIFGK